MPLIRADGIVPAAIIAAFAGWIWIRAARPGTAVAVAACPFVVLLAHTGLRWWLYGDVLPNTYYLKVSGLPLIERLSRGAATLWETVQSNLWLTFALGVLVPADKRLRLIAALDGVVGQYVDDAWYVSERMAGKPGGYTCERNCVPAELITYGPDPSAMPLASTTYQASSPINPATSSSLRMYKASPHRTSASTVIEPTSR